MSVSGGLGYNMAGLPIGYGVKEECLKAFPAPKPFVNSYLLTLESPVAGDRNLISKIRGLHGFIEDALSRGGQVEKFSVGNTLIAISTEWRVRDVSPSSEDRPGGDQDVADCSE